MEISHSISIGTLAGSGLKKGTHNIFIGRRNSTRSFEGSRNVLIGDAIDPPGEVASDLFIISDKMPTISPIYYLSIISLIPYFLQLLDTEYIKVMEGGKVEEVKKWMEKYRTYLISEVQRSTDKSISEVEAEFNKILREYMEEVNRKGEEFNYTPPPPLYAVHLYQVLVGSDKNSKSLPRFQKLLEMLREESSVLLGMDAEMEGVKNEK